MKQNMRTLANFGRKGMALLLALVMVLGVCMPVYATGDITEPTVQETTAPVESSEPTVETTVETEPETSAPETTVPETTVPETTVPETTVPETTVPEETVPEVAVPEEKPVMAPAPEKSAYEVAMEKLVAMAEEAKALEATEDVLDAFCEDVYALANEIADLWDAYKITDAQYFEAENQAVAILAYLETTYGYVDGKIQTLDTTKNLSNKALDTVTRAESGITFELYNYDGTINFTNDEKTALRSFAEHFAFHGSQTKYVDHSENTGSKSHETAHMEKSGRLLYKMNLSETGYPVLGTCSKNHPINSSIGYLFGEKTNGQFDHAVTPYQNITNTPLSYNPVTGYYEYSSAAHAADLSADGTEIYVRDYTERAVESANANQNGIDNFADFLPFNSLVGAVNNDGTTKVTVYQSTQNSRTNGEYHYTQNLDLWFGARMHATFYTPKDSKVNGENMVYEFSGDDDVMVYIDNIFVLDLGGAHGQCSGMIDFNTGLVEVWYDNDGDHRDQAANGSTTAKYYPSTIYNRYKLAYEERGWDAAKVQEELNKVFVPVLDENGNQLKVKDVQNNEYPQYRFKDYTQHTFDWFYMERYGSLANFNTKFNLPTLPENSLTVTKDVKNGPEDAKFRFTAVLKDEAGKALETVPYSLNGVKQANPMKLKEGGVAEFSLSDGDYITFDLAVGYTYEVKELDADKNGYVTTKPTRESGVMNDKDAVSLTYINDLQPAAVKTNKTVSEVENDAIGDYILTLDAYATGTITTVQNVKPADIVMIVDQSGSMLKPQDASKRLTKADLYNNAEAREHASHGLYYLAYGNSTVNFIFFKDGKWYRYETSLPHHKVDAEGKMTSSETGWDNYIPSIETILNGEAYELTLSVNLATGEKEDTIYTMQRKELSESDGVWTNFTQRDDYPYSGIWQTRYGAAYDAMNEFVDDLHEKGTNHNIAVVGFGGPNEPGSAIYYGSSSIQYNALNDSDYAAAFQNVASDTGYASLKDSIDALHTNQRSTYAGTGLDMAGNIYKNNPIVPADSRDRITILFSDGADALPDNVVGNAYTIKASYGGTVYTVGTAGAVAAVMQYASSNYPNAQSRTNTGDKVYDKYYFSASGAAELKNAFNTIMNEVSGSNVVLDEKAILRDTISGYFKLSKTLTDELAEAATDAEKTEILKRYIKVYTATCTGKDENGNYQFGAKELYNNAVISLDKSGQLDVVNVSGFDYADNHVAITDGNPKGKKLIVEIPIEIADSNTGGNHQPTNIDENTGIYDGNKKVEDFPLPHVDTPVDVTVKKKVTGNMGDWSKLFAFNVSGTKYSNESGAYYENVDDKTVGNSNYLKAEDKVKKDYTEDFELRHYLDAENNSKTLENLYYGSELTITEVPENYEVTIYVNGEKVSEGEDSVTVTVEPGLEIEFTNRYEVTIDTGIALDSLPYILIIAIVVAGAAFLFLRKRKVEED